MGFLDKRTLWAKCSSRTSPVAILINIFKWLRLFYRISSIETPGFLFFNRPRGGRGYHWRGAKYSYFSILPRVKGSLFFDLMF